MPLRLSVKALFVAASFLALGVACARKQPQAAQAPVTLQQALGRMQANDFAGAAKILEQVTQREPRNGRAWRNLGLAKRQLKDLDGAAAAYQQALQVEPEMPTPLLQLAIVSALKNNNDAAFDWLAKAKATRKIDMSEVDVTPELAPLKGDARYAAALPTRK